MEPAETEIGKTCGDDDPWTWSLETS